MSGIQRWRASKGDINKLKMEVSPTGKWVAYADYLSAMSMARRARELADEYCKIDLESNCLPVNKNELRWWDTEFNELSDDSLESIAYLEARQILIHDAESPRLVRWEE